MAHYDEAFHRRMAELYAQQAQPVNREFRPEGVDPSDWKNRHRISAKLSPDIYADLMAYCRKQGFSINSAIKVILTQHFKANV
jgi:hypothetical protein